MSFAIWLREILQDKEISPAELTRRMGLKSTGRVSEWMSGAFVPRASSCIKIAKALGLDESVVLIAAGHMSADPYLDPDSPEVRLLPLIRKVEWNTDRLDSMEYDLQRYIDLDERRKRERQGS